MFEGNTEDDTKGLVNVEGGEVKFISKIQVEEETSPSSVVVIPRDRIAAVGQKFGLWDPLSIFIQQYIDIFPWIRGGVEREVHPPSSTDAGHKLASVDINTRRIALQTKLAGVEQFVVRDEGIVGRKGVFVTAKISE